MSRTASLTRTRGRRTLSLRALEAELGSGVFAALLNENSPNPKRRQATLHRKLEWAATRARRRALRVAA
jgi:hypothetical protein